MEQDEGVNYDYSGYLIYNSILKYDPEKIDIDELLQELPAYDPGEQEHDGFKENPILDEYNQDDVALDWDYYNDLRENHKIIEYIQEDIVEKEIYLEGESVVRNIIETRSCNVVFSRDGYIFIRGSKSIVDKIKPYLYNVIGEVASLKQISFSPDFLLWLFYDYDKITNINKGFEIKRLTDANLEGKRDSFGQMNSISGSNDISVSPPFLQGILAGRSISMLGGRFRLDHRIDLKADIWSEGQIQVKSSQGDISRLDPLSRLLVSIRFVAMVTDAANLWKSLENPERYPPTGYFENLQRRLSDQGLETGLLPEELLTNIKNKRGE